MIKNYLKAFLLLCGMTVNAQSFFVNTVTEPQSINHLYQVNPEDYSMTEIFSCEPTNDIIQVFENKYTDIAINEDYVHYVSAWGSLYQRDINNADSCEFLGSFGKVINSLAVDYENNVYAAGYENGSGYVYKYSPGALGIQLLGNLPDELIPSGDLFFYKGHLLLTATKASNETKSYLYEINLNNVSESCEQMTLGSYQSYGAFAVDSPSGTKAYILTCDTYEPETTSLREVNIEEKTVGSVLHTFDYLFMGAAYPYSNTQTNVVCGTLGLNDDYAGSPFIKTNNPVKQNENLEIYTNIETENISGVHLHSIEGKKVRSFNLKGGTILSLSGIAAGNYIIEFNFTNGENEFQKLIIN